MLTESFGIIGMLFILFAFIMNQSEKWKHDFVIYDVFNTIGSFFLIIYSIIIKGYPFLVLNAVWFIVSVREIFLDFKKVEKSKGYIGHKRK